MCDPIILIGQRSNAMHPFPCSIVLQSHMGAPEREGDCPKPSYAVVCDGVIMAKYRDLAPAKMELARLREEWDQCDEMRPRTFQFVKDVKEDNE